jgi:hypothetical protein
VWESLDHKYDFAGKFGISGEEFLAQLGLYFGKKT